MDAQLRDRILQAAQLVRDEAAKRAGAWSSRIPGATRVFNDGSGIGVVVDGAMAPSARPNEYGLHHPLFGDKAWMRKNPEKSKTPHRPFLDEAVYSKADEATDVIAGAIDDWAKDAGWGDE